MAKKWDYHWLRSPRTTQERRANQDRNDLLIRGKRKNLPSAWDDIRRPEQKSWKWLGRKHQYREKDGRKYGWHEFLYSWRDIQGHMIARNIMHDLKAIGCYCENTGRGIKWFGPAME